MQGAGESDRFQAAGAWAQAPRAPRLLPAHRLAIAASALVALVVAVVWFASLGWRHLGLPDEGRYAEIAREMLASADWVTIRYQGLKYFEKPPFQMWMTVAAYRMFGIGEWQARLWSGLSGALGLLVIAHAARRWFGDRAGLLTALALLAMPAWVLGAHVSSLDMGVSAALAVVLGAVLLAQHPSTPPRARSGWMLVAWCAAAVAVLTKGLIGIVLPVFVLVIHAALHPGARRLRRYHVGPGLLLLLAVAAPWFVLVSWRNPEFARFFFVHEHFERFTSEVHQRAAPFWYFVPQFVLGFLPWLGLLPGIVRRVAGEARARTDGRDPAPLALLSTWAIAIFVFFSASGSKLPGYILPIYPALAILAAVELDALSETAWRRVIKWMAGTFSIAGLVALFLAVRLAHDDSGVGGFALGGAVAAAVALAVTVAALRLSNIGRALASRAVYALGVFLATTVALLSHEAVGGPRSGVALVPAVNAALAGSMPIGSMPIYSVRYLDHTLPFYLRRTTVMVAGADELAFGVQQEPSRWVPTLEEFERLWSSGAPALALMSPETWAELKQRGVQARLVAADRRRVVVTNVGTSAR